MHSEDIIMRTSIQAECSRPMNLAHAQMGTDRHRVLHHSVAVLFFESWMAMTYPSRPKYFAHRFLRLMGKACAANDIGPDACWLVAQIALLEDAKRYTGPVTFYNGQLMPLCGIESKPRLTRMRTRAVASGWLHYEPGSKGVPGKYWVTIPDDVDGIYDDAPVDESESLNKYAQRLRYEKRTPNVTESVPQTLPETYPKRSPYKPIPKPVPKPNNTCACFIEAWNQLIGSRCRVTEKRDRAFAVRVRDDWWRDNWRAAIERASQSSFLMGATSNWKADPDWFLKPDSVTRILEGAYDDRNNSGASGAAPSGNSSHAVEARNRAAFEAVFGSGQSTGPTLLDEASS
jgi:hypothetical protein